MHQDIFVKFGTAIFFTVLVPENILIELYLAGSCQEHVKSNCHVFFNLYWDIIGILDLRKHLVRGSYAIRDLA